MNLSDVPDELVSAGVLGLALMAFGVLICGVALLLSGLRRRGVRDLPPPLPIPTASATEDVQDEVPADRPRSMLLLTEHETSPEISRHPQPSCAMIKTHKEN